MYAAKINSPATTLNGGIDAVVTTIAVVDASVLPAAPNIAVIGTGEDAETILYTGISTNDLTGVTRGFQGTAKAWDSGAIISRMFTAYDHDTFKSNITDHGVATTGVHGVGSYYIPQAPAASHLVRTFTKGWTSGKLLKGAGANVDPTEIDKTAFGYLGSDELFIKELFPARMARLIYKLWADKNGFTERNTGGTNYSGLETLTQATGITLNNIAAIGSSGIYIDANVLNGIIIGAAFNFNTVVTSNTVYLGLFSENPASAYPNEANPHIGFKVVNGRIWTICKGTAAQTSRDTGVNMSQYETKWFTTLYSGSSLKLLVDGVDYTPTSPSIPAGVSVYWWSYIKTEVAENRDIGLMSLNLLRGYSA